MKISIKKVTIRDLFNGYENRFEDGVVGFGGRLNIRPKFQREFIYDPAQRDSVIDTIMSGYPINTMYWLRGEDDTFELMDGQQRTISICEYVEGNFAANGIYFFKLPQEQQDAILNYPLLIYIVENGTKEENLAWFRKINTAGEKLTDQEVRNAVFSGPWVSSAKTYFSKSFCPAGKIAQDYLNGVAIRQNYLETVIRWISGNKIDEYMAQHAEDENAEELWNYFTAVIDWVKKIFPEYSPDMKGVEWGILYNNYKDATDIDFNGLAAKVKELYLDDAITSKRGIYSYVFTGDVKALKLAPFPPSIVREVLACQGNKCACCKAEDIDMDTAKQVWLKEWKDGGKIEADNLRLVCNSCYHSYFAAPEAVSTEIVPGGKLKKIRPNDHTILFSEGPAGLEKLIREEMIPNA